MNLNETLGVTSMLLANLTASERSYFVAFLWAVFSNSFQVAWSHWTYIYLL